MNTLLKWTMLSLFLLPAYPAAAALTPAQLVAATADTLLKELTAKRAELEQDHSKLYALVEERVLPLFDFTRMSKLVLARNWRKASKRQRTDFTLQFKNLLVRTYSTALFNYTGQKIKYLPVRKKKGSKRVVVRSQIMQDSGGSLPINYSLIQNRDRSWKIYDVAVDGVSLVTNYRTSYNRIIGQQGMDTLISMLKEKSTQQ
ncbi:MAG TPA: ABC transporter substrate-binding protein [Gammaproteobacteria bacterium]|nr:ABC transporter substrate-binding protein [Gammaproteobacteria bacterium]